MDVKIKIVSIPYGKGIISLEIPSRNLLDIIKLAGSRVNSPPRIIPEGLNNFPDYPIRGEVLIVVPDATRKAHLNKLLPEILPKIKNNGDISIIVATGLHKPLDSQELTKLVSKTVSGRFEVYTHSQKEEELVNKGKTRQGVPIFLNRKLFEADCIITIGVIEPHLYAGYSGGAKTIAVGLAGEETINFTHHPRFLDKNGTTLGSVKGNLFQDTLWQIIKGLPIKYSLQIVNDANGNMLKIFSGNLRDTFREGVKFAQGILEMKVGRPADAIVCGVGYPKDSNLYQASRAFNYILNTNRPIVKKGGLLLVCAKLDAGWGKGLGEKRFAKVMKEMNSPRGYIERVRKSGCLAGEHRAYMVARALTKARLGVVGEKAKIYCRGTPFLSFTDLTEAVSFILDTDPQAEFYVVAHALSCVHSLKS